MIILDVDKNSNEKDLNNFLTLFWLHYCVIVCE